MVIAAEGAIFWFNVFECLLWISLGVVILLKCSGQPRPVRRLGLTASVTFLLFGASDAIETRTGAWWTPLWLLLIKVGCVASLLVCLVLYLKQKKDRH